MAAAGKNPIRPYRSDTPGAEPDAADLADGEIAINTADKCIFAKNPAGAVVKIADAIPTDDVNIVMQNGTAAERGAVIPATGVPIWATDNKDLNVGDYSTPGGVPVNRMFGPVVSKSADFSVTAVDHGTIFVLSANLLVALPDIADVPVGFYIWVIPAPTTGSGSYTFLQNSAADEVPIFGLFSYLVMRASGQIDGVDGSLTDWLIKPMPSGPTSDGYIWFGKNLQLSPIDGLVRVLDNDGHVAAEMGQGAGTLLYDGSGNQVLSSDEKILGGSFGAPWSAAGAGGQSKQFMIGGRGFFAGSTTTTNATATTIVTIDLQGNIGAVVAIVKAKRTGGSAGAAGDAAMYRVELLTNAAGSGVIGSASITPIAESQPAWDVQVAFSSGALLIKGVGAANNNISWSANATVD